ncbi:MAG: hypothetical protein Q7S75_03065 [bacterium]|nr:hypothetical protein [bacterium]
MNLNVVVPIDYSNNRACNGLSPATIAVLADAVKCLKKSNGEYAIAHCVANLPEKGMRPEDSLRWKEKILAGLAAHMHIEVWAKNSIEEALEIRNALRNRGVVPRRIIVLCDYWHAMRLRMIWRHFFPTSVVEFRTDNYVRGSDFAPVLLRSQVTWFLANLAGLVLMAVLGMKRMSSINEP